MIRCAQQTMYKTNIPASDLFGGTKRDWANSRPFVYLTGPEVHSLICSIFVYEKNSMNLDRINFLSHWLTRHRHAAVPKEITITYVAQEKGCLFWKCPRALEGAFRLPDFPSSFFQNSEAKKVWCKYWKRPKMLIKDPLASVQTTCSSSYNWSRSA